MHNDADLIKNISDLISQAITSVYAPSIKVRLREQFNNTTKTNIYQLSEFYEKVLNRYSHFIDSSILDEINNKIQEFNIKNNIYTGKAEKSIKKDEQDNQTQNPTYEGDIRYAIDLDNYKKFAIDRINNMVLDDDTKKTFIDKINNSNRISEVRENVNEARKMRDEIRERNQLVPYQNEETKEKNQLIPYQKEEIIERPKPIKVNVQKPSWIKRNYKKVLIAAGIATIAVLAAPYIVTPLMTLNSIAWHQVPALQGVLHGINQFLGTIGGISPFANFSYSALSGEWILNGTIINQMASIGSMQQAILGIITDLGVVGVTSVTLTKLAKKGYSKLSTLTKNKEKIKKSNRTKNNDTKNNDKTNNFDRVNNIYNNIKQYKKNKKDNAKENRSKGFVNNFKQRFNNIKQKSSNKFNHNLNRNKEGIIEFLRTLNISEEQFNEISNKIKNANSEQEIDKILDDYNDIINNKNSDSKSYTLEQYKNVSIDHIRNLKITPELKNEIISKIYSSKTKEEITNIMNNSPKIIAELKKNYIKKIASLLNNGIDNMTAQMIAASIRQCNTLSELQKCMKESDRLIEHVMNNKENEDEMGKKRAA